MADIVDLPGETLETRYATSHVGGAFDAKNIQLPKTLPKALEDAMWRKYTGSLYIEGLDTTPYGAGDTKRRFITIKLKPVGSGLPGRYIPAPFIPTPAVFGPLIRMPVTIYWDTDSDIWDQDKIVGQSVWGIYDVKQDLNDGYVDV